MTNWIIPEDLTAIFLLPVKDISLNEPQLGNHPSKEACKEWCEKSGNAIYRDTLLRRIEVLKKQYEKDPNQKLKSAGYNIVAEVWPGKFQESHKDIKPVSFFWEDYCHNNKKVHCFTCFEDVFNYVKTEGINIHPIHVYLERDGEIILMEGRHRLISAIRLDLEKIPCRVSVRRNSYEPDFVEKIRKIKETRFIPSI